MKNERIKELRRYLNEENIDLTELVEIENAFALIPDARLMSDLRENATASDMLDELEILALTS